MGLRIREPDWIVYNRQVVFPKTWMAPMGLVKNWILKGMLSEGRQGEKAAGLDFQNGFWIKPSVSPDTFSCHSER